MAEFLSMTLLSAEPISSSKPQAAQSNDGATEPDQSFAATLAAQVNGTSPEKPVKASAKTRQNTASDAANSKDIAAEGSAVSDAKSDSAKSIPSKEASPLGEESLLSEDTDTALAQNDAAEPEQSHWLNLLEKAKSLQERLSKEHSESTGRVDKNTADKASVDKSTADKRALDEAAADKSTTDNSALVKAAVDKDIADNSALAKAAVDKGIADQSALTKAAVDNGIADHSVLAKAAMDEDIANHSVLAKAAVDKGIAEQSVLAKATGDKGTVDNSPLDEAADKVKVDKHDVTTALIEKGTMDKVAVDKTTVDNAAIHKGSVEKAPVDGGAVDKTLVGKAIVDKVAVNNADAAVGDRAPQAAASIQQHDKIKVKDPSGAEAITSDKVNTGEQKDSAIALNEKLMAAQSAEPQLTKEELKAVKLMTQSDTTSSNKNPTLDATLKQTTATEKTGTEVQVVVSEALADQVVDKPLLVLQKDTSAEQHRSIASFEKPLKNRIEPTVVAAPETQTEVDVMVATTATMKTPLQSEQASTVLKAAIAATTSDESKVEAKADTEIGVTQNSATEVKVSVQAQSAAALVAPAAQQAKSSTPEAKVSTEEALKQIQATSTATQAEQGTSSSSGESSHQGSAETLLNVIEQQKSSNPVTTEASTFSSQLKSTLEKTSSGITIAGREAVSQEGQKQVDQLGQKLNLIQPEASNQLKEKMLMMVKDKVHTAEIRLDPSELGSMQIKISLQQDQMSVQFMVQQGNAKELMEQQMPKLKELLQQQGIELSQGSVQQQNQSSSGQEGGRRAASGTAMGKVLDPSDEQIEAGMLPPKNSDRVVDYYA